MGDAQNYAVATVTVALYRERPLFALLGTANTFGIHTKAKTESQTETAERPERAEGHELCSAKMRGNMRFPCTCYGNIDIFRTLASIP